MIAALPTSFLPDYKGYVYEVTQESAWGSELFFPDVS